MRNALEAYRRTQRELRREFDAFTKANCPTCPTPCCVQPSRIAPSDILLAEASGWRSQVALTSVEAGMVSEVAGRASSALIIPLESADPEPPKPCEFLGERGCTFPTDLRPFGCTTYLCKYMYERLDRPTLSRLKRLVRELERERQAMSK